MSANLKLLFLKGQGESFEFTPDKAVTIGRATDSVVHLNDAHVSRRHATLNCIEGKWTLVDNGSRHGTMINGTVLPAQEPCVMAHGDQVGIAPYVLRVDLGGETMTLIHVSSEDSAADVKLVEQHELENLVGRRLKVLLDVAAKMQEAPDEKSLATEIKKLKTVEKNKLATLVSSSNTERIAMEISRQSSNVPFLVGESFKVLGQDVLRSVDDLSTLTNRLFRFKTTYMGCIKWIIF